MGITEELAKIRRELDETRRGNHVSGTVISSDPATAKVTMAIVHADGTVENMSFPVATNFVPEVGSKAVVTMNGIAPLVIPLNGEQVAIDGSWLRSPDFVSGVSGWKIDADGSAEFNNVVVRGRADLGPGTEVLSVNAQGIETNTDGWDEQSFATAYSFDTAITNWVGSSATLAHEKTTLYNPPGGLKATATAATYEVRSPVGANKVPCTAGLHYYALLPVLAAHLVSDTMTPCIRWWNVSNVQVGADLVGTAIETFSDKWQFGFVEGDAPATAVGFSLVYKFTNGASGNVHYIDEANLITPSTATVSRTTANFRTGAAALRITSGGAGPALAVTPDTGPNTGYAVVEDEYYYFRTYYRDANAKGIVVVPAWFDSNGVFISATINADTFGNVGSSSTWRLYNAVWKVPKNAARLSISVGFFATAGSQVMDLDDISLTKMSTIRGGVWRSPPEEGQASQVSDEMSVYLRTSDSGFPYMFADGHVFSRVLHGRLTTPTGSQNVTDGSWQVVTLNTVDDLHGFTTVTSGLVIPRTGIYKFSGQVNWNLFVFVASGGMQAVAVDRFDAAGNFVRRICAQSMHLDTTAASICQSCSTTARANKGDIIKLMVYNGHAGVTLTIQGGGGSVGIEHVLSVTYEGEVI